MTGDGETGRPGIAAPSRPARDVLDEALATVDADGFVHAGTGVDPDLRYLTGVTDRARSAVDRVDRRNRVAFGYTDGTALLVLPSGVPAPSEFSDRVERVGTESDPAARLVAALADRCDGGRMAAPRQLPHDAACYVQDAGFELVSTPAVGDARAVKTEAEIAAVGRAADAAVAGMARARDLLVDTTVADGALELDGRPLTTERLRRAIDAAVVSSGGYPFGNTSVDAPVGDSTPVAPDTPIRIELAPRDRTGYHALLGRTLTVEGTGGWHRRAHVACEAARRVGIDVAEPGTAARTVSEEVRAELGAFGFDPGRVVGSAGGGLGLSLSDRPSPVGTADLDAGMVLALAPRLDPDSGLTVGLADTILVADDGAQVLTACSTSMRPEP